MNEQDRDIIAFLQERLAAHEGGAPAVSIGYDDATFHYIITQPKGFGKDRGSEMLASARSLSRAFTLAMSGKRFD